MERVRGKVAIITGAASGIGRAAAILLAKEGAAVAMIDIDIRGGNETLEKIISDGGEAGFWCADVSSEEMIVQSLADIWERFGRLDILVNNAGILGANKPTHELTQEDWNMVMNVNAKSVFLCTKHAVPLMRKSGGGSIINIASIYGVVGTPDFPPYHAAKAAVRLMSKTDAMLYARDKIRVNSILPGVIQTPMIDKLLAAQDDPLKAGNTLTALHPIGRLGQPDDIAYGILYLASDEAGFITGSELIIDGGYTAH